MVRCAIVGAGPSGLAAARWALAYDIEPVVFEATDWIGGIWCYRPEDGEYATVMKTTTINTSKELCAFSDCPPPAEYANFMRHDAYMDYLRMYADQHDLLTHVRFKHPVVQVRRAPDYDASGKWTVEYKDPNGNLQEESFDCVLVAVGHNNMPNFPGPEEEWWPGQEKFKGRILHTKQYKEASGFDDSVSVVVGCGNSAMDAAVDLSRVTKKAYLSVRRGVYLYTRLGEYGWPMDLKFITRFTAYFWRTYMPKWLMERQALKRVNKRFDHALYGLKPDHSILARQGTINDELPSRILTGTVVVKPAIKEFTENGIVWADGNRTEPVDNVILATGYRVKFDMIEEGKLIPMKGNFARLYKYIYPVGEIFLRHNTLGVIGLIQPSGPVVTAAEMQARFFFHQLRSRTPERPRGLLPSNEAMTAEVDRIRRALEANMQLTLKPYWFNYVLYMDSLAEVIGCKPNLRNLFWKDPVLAKAVLFGPNCAYVNRLDGPHKWDGAKDAIMRVNERVRKPFATRPITVTQDDKFLIYLLVSLVACLLAFIVMRFT
ncbi:CBN-FMO-2 protein [Aphelenchoides avenae]|nr:CBN-FMO-2 protein [Aphelenchus avenae]